MQSAAPITTAAAGAAAASAVAPTGIQFPSLQQFADKYNKYPSQTLLLYHLYRDLIKKHTAAKILVMDGEVMNQERWLVACEYDDRSRIIYPIAIGEQVNLSELMKSFLVAESINIDLYVAVMSYESIM